MMVTTQPYPYDEYYGHFLVFKVEDVYFSAHKMAFSRPGSFFEAVFSFAKLGASESSSTEVTTEGSSAQNPIILDGISKTHFRSFLRVLCPFDGIPPCDTYEDWKGVLDLATMWDFYTIRTKAISSLSPFLESITVPERICLARKYEVKPWLVDALARAASKPIDRKEFERTGVDLHTINGLFAVRDAAMQGEIGIIRRASVEWCKICHHTHLDVDLRPFHRLDADWINNFGVTSIIELKRLVRREFADELAEMRND